MPYSHLCSGEKHNDLFIVEVHLALIPASVKIKTTQIIKNNWSRQNKTGLKAPTGRMQPVGYEHVQAFSKT